MKKIFIAVAMLVTITANAQKTDSIEAIELLRKLEQKYNSLSNLTYHSLYRSVYNIKADSVFEATGTVWLEPRPQDSIFGAIFHLQGAYQKRTFEYYYDGNRSFEVDHDDSCVRVFNPYAYENNANNPAKARMALLPFQTLLVKKQMLGFLLKQKPAIQLLDSRDHQIIVLAYPLNSINELTTDTLYLDKVSGFLVRTGRICYWNGTVFKASYQLSNIVVNIPQMHDNIILSSAWNAYKTLEYKRPVSKDTGFMIVKTGISAPDFSYATFNGDTVSLRNMRGKYVLLDFWETWCGYCILALPKITALYNQYHAKGLEVIGMTTENEKHIARIIEANQLPYIHAKGDKAVLKNYNVSGRPAYVLIDKEGKVITTRWEEIEKFLGML